MPYFFTLEWFELWQIQHKYPTINIIVLGEQKEKGGHLSETTFFNEIC